MAGRWSRIGGALLAAVLLAGALAGGLAPKTAVQPEPRAPRRGDFDPRAAPPPWRHRCRIAIAAYEDGSASLYCAGQGGRFATVDAESGRIRMQMPWTGGPGAGPGLSAGRAWSRP